MKRLRSLLVSFFWAPSLLFAWTAPAQEFPARPVTLVVPYPPGGSVDAVARLFSTTLSELSHKTFVVDNRAGGGGGVVGATEVMKAAPDGYTLLLNASIHIVTPLLNPKTPYDVFKDFTPIAGLAAGPLLISTPQSTRANSLKEFFDTVKANPDLFNFATSGYGSAGHLTIELLKKEAGIDIEVVAYKGGGPALSDLMGNQVQLLADPMTSTLPHVQSGRLKALAVTSLKRSPLAPEVPTVEESGMPPLEMYSWYALWGPKNLNSKTIAFLNEKISETVQSKQFKDKLTVFGFEPMYKDGMALKNFMEHESNRYSAIIKAANLKVN